MMKTTPKACYRKLKKYKYQLMQDYAVLTTIKPAEDIKTSFVDLAHDGTLLIKNRYAWDGASGPTPDWKSIMRASLVHDAFYQLMRLQHLDYQTYRYPADQLLKTMCLEDGMLKPIASIIYWAVKQFGEQHARPTSVVSNPIICVP